MTQSREPVSCLKIALFGHPVGHSRSRELFAAVSGRSCPEIDYQPVDVLPEDLPNALARLRRGQWDGANVTIPHKGAAASLVDSLDSCARDSGAVNVIVRSSDGALRGINTDGEGFCDSLARFSPSLPKLDRGSVVVLGAGGAARGVAAALRKRGALVTFITRRPQELCSEAGGIAQRIEGWDSPNLGSCIEEALLIVQATPLGMAPKIDEMPPVPLDSIGQAHFVVDLIYNPTETCFMRSARHRGARVLNGWPMLLYQAARALDHWAGAGHGRALLEHWL